MTAGRFGAPKPSVQMARYFAEHNTTEVPEGTKLKDAKAFTLFVLEKIKEHSPEAATP